MIGDVLDVQQEGVVDEKSENFLAEISRHSLNAIY